MRSPASVERPVNCAIYTRKSTEEGLEQDFNSLDAQRAACAAFIESQRSEGWIPSKSSYDDGGLSGATLKRPALQRLLDDVGAGLVDVIVVYKIDRLTRSLHDFARIVEVLDVSKASFVSVTQAFNTTSSMGRLTLNVLLSFAQFEREVTGERIRDKIAASRARGMWMGGVVPLGYDVADRKLMINPGEAETVRHIYQRYCELDSMLDLQAELEASGIRSKLRISAAGNRQGGSVITCGSLYFLLQNRTYVGEVLYKGNIFPGEHEGLLDPALFAAVQQKLASRRCERRRSRNGRNVNLLTGLAWDKHGRRLTPTHTSKGVKHYRYYSSPYARTIKQPRTRISAGDLEDLVVQRLRSFLEDQKSIHDAIRPFTIDADCLVAALAAASETVEALGSGAFELRELLLKFISRVEVHDDRLDLHLLRTALLPNCPAEPPLIISCGVRLEQRPRNVRLVLSPSSGTTSKPRRDPSLVKLLVKAFAARAAIEGSSGSVEQTAKSQGYGCRHFRVLLRISYLSPQIVTAIVDGRQPAGLTRSRLARMSNLPFDWQEQATALGLSTAGS